MTVLTNIKHVFVPHKLCEQGLEHMRSVGHQGVEGVALWAGCIEGANVHVLKTIVPKQSALRLRSGLAYVVDGDELHRINVELYREGLALIAQLHSHPSEAYHSETDDEFPIATTEGSLSIVVPDFARGPMDPRSWAVYRLQRGGWDRLPEASVAELIRIQEA